MPNKIEQPQDDSDLSTETPETTTGLAADIQHETKRAINRTYICGRLTKWAIQLFGELGLIEFIQEQDLAQILKTAIKTTPDDCFREQKPAPRKTSLQTRSFFQPVMTKAFDLCSAEALEQCRNLNLSTGLKLLVCAMEFARVAGLEVPPALISCFEEIREKLTKGSELEKLSMQAQALFPSLAPRPATQQQPELEINEEEIPSLIGQAQRAEAIQDWKSAVELRRELIRIRPLHPANYLFLSFNLDHLGLHEEALEIYMTMTRLPAYAVKPELEKKHQTYIAYLQRKTGRRDVAPPESAATTYTAPKFYKDVREADLPHLSVNDLILFSMQAQSVQNDYDHESAIVFLQERLRRDPNSRSALMNLQHAYKQLARYRESLEVLERLRNHPSIRGNPEKEGMIDGKIADMRRHIEAEETGQQRRANTVSEKPITKIFWRDFLNNLCGKVEMWPAAGGGGHGWHAVPADEQDTLEKTLILCRRTLQHNRMLPTGTPPEKNLNSTIKDVRRGYINTHVLDRLVLSAGGMAGRVIIELSDVL